ncbi:MAG: hypothetical protein KDA53_15885 [Hyphomonas sp.]|nr:hypothetical protein [Hyphomonas sp.]
MREEEAYQDLAALFAAEDRKMDPKPFVAGVMGKVRRRTLRRKLVIFGVGTVGAAVAALQVPKLFGEWITVDNTIVSAISTAQQQAGMQAGLLSTTNPLWIGIAAMVVFSLAAVATMERA